MKSLEASPEGADKLRQARDESGRTVDSPRWLEESSKVLNSAWKLGDYYAEGVNEGSWRRFLYRVRPIKAEIFKAYCQVLGVPYQEVVEVLMKDDGFIVPEGETVSIPNLDGATIRWVGREDLVEKLVQRLLGDCRLLMLVGLTGIGKTALAARLLTDRALHPVLPTQKVLALDRPLPNFENLASEILGATAIADTDLQKNSDKLIAAMVARLRTQPCLLVLDMVEEILTVDRKGTTTFIDPAFDRFLEQVIRAESMPSRVILTSQERPPSLYQGRHEGRSHLEALLGLPETEALQLFSEWGVAVVSNSQDATLLQRLIHLYEGHPLALRVIAGEIQAEPYAGCVQTYWAEFGETFLAVEQQKQADEVEGKSDRLFLTAHRPRLQDMVYARIDQALQRLSQVEPQAHRLLLMAAIYRRAVEPAAWYRLLDDLPPEVACRSLRALERRYLIERERNQQQILYRQHSLIRCVALQHLDQTEEEITAP